MRRTQMRMMDFGQGKIDTIGHNALHHEFNAIPLSDERITQFIFCRPTSDAQSPALSRIQRDEESDEDIFQ